MKIIAIGSEQIMPKINGINNENVITALEYYENTRLKLGKNIIIIGAGEVGCEIAILLSMQKKHVYLLDTIDLEKILDDEMMLYHAGLITIVRKNGIRIIDKMVMEGIEQNEIIINNKYGLKDIISFDNIIIASGFKSKKQIVKKLLKSFMGNFPEIYTIGDCVYPGKLYGAIHSGAELAWQI